MTISDNLTEEFWRAAVVAWGCFVIGVYCFRVALSDPQRRSRLIGQLLSRGLILCGMLVLTGFGSHAVQEYRQLADRAGGDGPLHSVGETLLAEVRNVDRYKSPDGWQAEFETYGPGRNHRGTLTAGDSAGQMSVAIRRSSGGWGKRLDSLGDSPAAAGNPEGMQAEQRGDELRIQGQRF